MVLKLEIRQQTNQKARSMWGRGFVEDVDVLDVELVKGARHFSRNVLVFLNRYKIVCMNSFHSSSGLLQQM